MQHSFKYSLEQIKVKTELIENYEKELQNLYSALKESESKNKKLEKEIENYKKLLNSDSKDELINNFPQKIENHEKNKIKNERELDYYKQELNRKNEEISSLKERLSNENFQERAKITKNELEKIVILKDEQMRNLNRKFQVMLQKLYATSKEKEFLEASNKTLEEKKKELSEK